MSFLLMIFLALVCLFDAYPAPLGQATPGESALWTGGALLLVVAHAFFVSRRFTWRLARSPARRDRLLAHYERGRLVHQGVQFGLYGLTLVVLGWGWAVRQFWRLDSQPLPGIEVLTLLPFLLGQVLTWVFFYDADRAAHAEGRSHWAEARLPVAGTAVPAAEAGEPANAPSLSADTWLLPPDTWVPPPRFGGRSSYVLFQVRQKLALVLIPIALLIAAKEIFRFFPTAWEEWGTVINLLGVVVLGCVFVSMPLLIRAALGLKPLPPGALRDRLLAAADRLGFRCTDILLWSTRGGMANAMVIGLVPWLRYVVFTDRLIEEFPEDEVEAVLGHEVGHIRHQHMIYYLVFLTLSMMVLGMLADDYLLPILGQLGTMLAESWPVLPASLGKKLGPTGDLAVFPMLAVLLGYVFLAFGFLSRRCERQADVFGCRAGSCDAGNCLAHSKEEALTPGGRGLCPTGIRTFIRALEKVASVNGISRDRPGFLQSWQHSTIASRVAFLQSVLVDPRIEAVFQRRMTLMKSALMVGLGALLVGLLVLHGWRW
jgi:Zn-dependent protease with chaperone function